MFFPGMDGGFPGGFPGGPPRRRRGNADTTKFYKLLEVEKSASAAEIKKAYRKLAVKHHPDKGGDPEKFKEITKAYEVLSDDDKRQKYDEGGEEAVDADDSDPFSDLFGPSRSNRTRRRQTTKDVVQPLNVTLEQLYNGQTKKMAITRQVIDKKRGVETCSDCQGRGMKIEVIRMGPMIQQVQSACSACSGEGKRFQTKQAREVLEVHIPKGAPDGHKVVFKEMADEHPDADAGDVVFVLKQSEHSEFKRRGADLFLEKTISLAEALCGFEMEVTHLDGRKLVVKTAPGEIVRPLHKGFDPLAQPDEGKMEWEAIQNADCPSIETVASAETTDVETLQKAAETQLKRKGIDVGAIVVDGKKAVFKQGTREEIMAGKKTAKGKTMYVIKDPDASSSFRLMKAVKDEGMPTPKNPFIHGNLFLILTIQFPETLASETQEALRKVLPPPLNVSKWDANDETVEVHQVVDQDPVQSYMANKINMQTGGDSAYDDDDDDEPGMGGPGGIPCQQM